MGVGGIGSPALLGLGQFGNTGMTPMAIATEDPSVDEAAVGGLGIRVRDQDEERRKRLEEIMKMMAHRWGRVCQEGVERCARRMGLDCMWEEGAKRTLSIAGSGILVDVEFIGEDVGAVVLSFPASTEAVGKLAGRGAKILMRDLKGNGTAYVSLRAFVQNLERLARMDQLGGGGISCFDAVEGVYASLEKIFEWELRRLRLERGVYDNDEMLKEEVMCKGNGRPRMYANGRVGLTLQYWQDRRLVPLVKHNPDAMSIDSPNQTELDNFDTVFYSVFIECEASSSELYPPIRVSDAWVGPQIERPPSFDTNPLYISATSSIDWQEPPPTLVSSEPPPEAMDLDSSQSLPRIPPKLRFVAHFEPPIIIPLETAFEIYNSVGAPLAQESIQPTTYESMLFGTMDKSHKKSTSPPEQDHPIRTVTSTITSYPPTGPPVKHRHQYTLFATHQQAYAHAIDHMPFSHPRQLVAILPVLRQWALLGSILRRSFAPEPTASENNNNQVVGLGKTINNDNKEEEEEEDDTEDTEEAEPNGGVLAQSLTLEEELAALLNPVPTQSSRPSLPIDIGLSLSPSPPRLTIILGSAQDGRPSTVRGLHIAIGLNGAISLLAEDGEIREQTRFEMERARRVLEISESLGVLVAWMNGAGKEAQR